jgi:hypothetical protein
MKKTLLHTTLFGFLLLLPTAAGAFDFEVDGIFYNINSDNASVSVTYETTAFRTYTGNVVIPDTVTHNGVDYLVTAIGNSTFFYCYDMTSVTIPNTVTSIGYYAFSGCAQLTEIKLPETLVSIGNCAFENCHGLTEVVIPDAVTTLGQDPFFNCRQLERVVIGRSVSSVGSYLFSGCTKLSSVTCWPTTPPACHAALFIHYDVYANATLHVPPESLDAYQSAMFWKEFSQIVGDATVGIPGDVNGDGEVTVADANNTIHIIVNGGGSGGHSRVPGDGDERPFIGDVNGDGEVNIADINAIIDYILGNAH